jgi:hypothetical protein
MNKTTFGPSKISPSGYAEIICRRARNRPINRAMGTMVAHLILLSITGKGGISRRK